MTEKLFYADAHMRKFTARVLTCEERGGRFAVTLDRTAFFPEGGGQGGDTGALGGVRVTDTREEKGEIVHFCGAPLTVGAEVTGELDGETRFARMQIHSAEHLVSGHAHALWGCENIGFHMDEHGATIDFDREIDAEQLLRLERLANEDVWKNLPINILWPTEEELAAMPFRQKKALAMPVRIVEVPGVDLCACCAPHVSFTGEIGLIRLKDRMRHRGGVRFTMLAGRAAYEDAALCAAETEALSRLFSAPQNALCAAAERFRAPGWCARAICSASWKRRSTPVPPRSGGMSRRGSPQWSHAREICSFLKRAFRPPRCAPLPREERRAARASAPRSARRTGDTGT